VLPLLTPPSLGQGRYITDAHSIGEQTGFAATVAIFVLVCSPLLIIQKFHVDTPNGEQIHMYHGEGMTGGALLVAISITYIALVAPLVGIFFLIKVIPRGSITAGLYWAAMAASIPIIILEDMKVCRSTCAARPSSIFSQYPVEPQITHTSSTTRHLILILSANHVHN